MKSHNQTVLDQFTRQAVSFSIAPAIKNQEALELLVRSTRAGMSDTVLDVACGPGIVACAFAPVSRHVTGIDLTPAMIAQARSLQLDKGLANLTWQIGDVVHLPFEDNSFSIVASRYSFHHLIDPPAVLAEMARVCISEGRVAVADVVASSEPKRAAAFDYMEKLRDPSHVRALTLAEMADLFQQVGLGDLRTSLYSLEIGLEDVLRGSSPNPGDADKVRQLFAENVDMGIVTRREGAEIHLAYPIAITVAEKPLS